MWASEFLTYRGGELWLEDCSVRELADRHGTPLYLYSRGHLEARYRELQTALAELQPHFFYAVKANSCGAVIRVFAELGAGADVVSGGELYRARRAGIPAARCVFAGVGKTAEEIAYALGEGIGYFTVESEAELERLDEIARRLGGRARIALRVNPDVDPQTHKYTSTGKRENKFGVDLERAERAYADAARRPGLEIVGLHMHLGSPIMTVEPYAQAADKVLPLCAEWRRRYPSFRVLDLGGGFGIPYRPEQAPFDLAALARELAPRLRGAGLQVAFEPGRFLVGNAGALVTRVQYLKDNPFKQFVIGDAAMNDLIRPPLYQAHHEIAPVRATAETVLGDLVGPICESGDFLAAERQLPAVRAGDLLVILSAGAYGFAMASNYNSRGRAAEALVSGATARLARARETWADLVRAEDVAETGAPGGGAQR